MAFLCVSFFLWSINFSRFPRAKRRDKRRLSRALPRTIKEEKKGAMIVVIHAKRAGQQHTGGGERTRERGHHTPHEAWFGSATNQLITDVGQVESAGGGERERERTERKAEEYRLTNRSPRGVASTHRRAQAPKERRRLPQAIFTPPVLAACRVPSHSGCSGETSTPV